MKRLLILFVFCNLTNLLQAQPWNGVTKNRNFIFTRTEVEPVFEGGSEAWNAFLERTLDKEVLEHVKKPGEYIVTVQFIVHKDGSLTDVETIAKSTGILEKEAIRIIKQTPKWIPAMQNGHAVSAYHKQRIRFSIP